MCFRRFAIIVDRTPRGEISRVKIYFDWILKASFSVSGVGSTLTDVYYFGELVSTTANDTLQPRTALTTYRVSNGGPWTEPSRAFPEYSATTSCPPYGVDYAGKSPSARRDGVNYDSTTVGSGVTCTPAGATLF